jgi:prophage regulatory protein
MRVLRRHDVEQMTGLSRSTIYAKMADGSFPKPIKLSKRAVGWPDHAIVAWLTALSDDFTS